MSVAPFALLLLIVWWIGMGVGTFVWAVASENRMGELVAVVPIVLVWLVTKLAFSVEAKKARDILLDVFDARPFDDE